MKIGPAVLTVVSFTAFVMGAAWAVSGTALTLVEYPAPLVLAGVAMTIQWVAFVPAIILKTEKFYDLTGTATFLCLVGISLWVAHDQGVLSTRRVVLVTLVALWSLRLGTYLVRRIQKVGHDSRFASIKVNGPHFLVSWTLQGAWAFLTSLPVIVVTTASAVDSALGIWDFLGWFLWLTGFVIEVVADGQKAAFRARQSGPRRWIDEGLWAHAQHPNYFGEILLWTGLFVANIGVYQGPQWGAVVSPLFVLLVLTRISGIPLLQAQGRARWGDDPEYRRYLARTHLLIPLPPKGPN